MIRKTLGIDYAARVSVFFGVLGIKDLFIMPQEHEVTVGRRLLHALDLIRNLPKFVKKYNVFVFISPPYFHFPSFFFLKLLRIKTISIVVDLYGEITKEKLWQAPVYKRILRKVLYPFYELSECISIKLSGAVFCVSAYSVNKYRKLNRNVYRIFNGVDVATVSRLEPAVFDKETIFYMGGFLKWRGIDILVKAFETVRKKHDVQLVLMGGSEEELRFYPELRELLEKVKDVVVMRYRPHEEALSYLKGAKIAVMPARDTFMTRALSSLKVFEYIAAEIPQVCTDTGEHAGWVRKLDVGVVVRDTPEDLARGISLLLEDEKLYKKMKDNCRERKWGIDNKIMEEPMIRYFESINKNLDVK